MTVAIQRAFGSSRHKFASTRRPESRLSLPACCDAQKPQQSTEDGFCFGPNWHHKRPSLRINTCLALSLTGISRRDAACKFLQHFTSLSRADTPLELAEAISACGWVGSFFSWIYAAPGSRSRQLAAAIVARGHGSPRIVKAAHRALVGQVSVLREMRPYRVAHIVADSRGGVA